MKRKGFSIIELIMVVVVVAIAAVAIGSAFAYMSRSQTLGVDLDGATRAAQECAAHIVGQGRRPGSYAAVPAGASACDAVPAPVPAGASACDAVPAPGGYTRTVTVTDVAGPSGTVCTGAGWNCKSVAITVARGTATAAVNFMLVNY
jgi:prepilin-type N-terminal cleavage/methylation domain-containing protein